MKAVALTLLLFSLLFSMASQAQPRVVVTGGTLTEIVFALDGDALVVATDTSSMYPPEVSDLPKVGYYRELAAEGVLAQQPTAVWALEGTGSEQTLAQISATGTEVKRFTKPYTVDGLFELIEEVGIALERTDAAQSLIQHIRAGMPSKPEAAIGSALFLLQASERGIVVAGEETVPNLLFAHAGVSNLAEHQGFKPLTMEFLALNQPDFLVAPAHVVNAAGGRTQFCEQSVLRFVAAARECRLLVLDSLLALGMTPRLSHAISEISEFANARKGRIL
ncbi:MAG: ABC-type hemin uptake system substrate-binding component [Idiomarinaceae bacterium HL-53]|nr:MAG: ABC-type hemin uptake system substrate-binding component [Idiomarinaceae bacterium HL-53]CUS48011.1 iron complex transport system substrate-binding protein [Idiomarinaceae bacterium HL-53]